MVEFDLDDDDRGRFCCSICQALLTLLGSNASSDNDQDELMDDAEELGGDIDQDGDGDGEGDEDDNDDENGDDDDGGDDEEDSPERPQIRRPSLPTTNTSSENTSTFGQVNGGPTSHPHPLLTRTSASPRETSAPLQSARFLYEVRPEALTASTYDIVPTIAAPQGTSINAITATPDMRFWFSGGTDGYIRKYDGVASINGKTLLTVAQRHPFVDSVVKAGVLMTYWDNEEPLLKSEDHPLSPVYSLAVQSQALWMLSGLESGAINLYSVRHDEGKRITHLSRHKSAVSVLTIARDEKSVLSGSWDKSVFDWDLNTGQVKRSFEGSGGQISAIEIRPTSSLAVPEESGETVSASKEKTFMNGNTTLTNGVNGHNADDGSMDAHGSPTDSLFGGGSDANSLFGETAGDGAPSGGNFGDEDDDFSRAIGAELDNQGKDTPGNLNMGASDTTLTSRAIVADASAACETQPSNGTLTDPPISNGVLQPDSAAGPSLGPAASNTQDAVATSDSTFLAASTDGTLRVWDRRQPNPVARIPTRTGVPPWCTAACWSPDGNYIYAGRRNGAVEEFSLHKGLKAPERTFKFPHGSGAVSALRAMPNGRHLIWYVLDKISEML